MNKIKLKPKQLTILTKIQEEKNQLTKLYNELNQKESLVLELIFEENGVTLLEEIQSVNLNEGCLEYEYKVKEDKPKKKKVEKPKE